ncbi:hypothetical protein GCM10028833_37020 [Glycomyces tarimensis]
MSYRYASEIRREAVAETIADAIFAFLDERGVPISEEERQRVSECTDADVL